MARGLLCAALLACTLAPPARAAPSVQLIAPAQGTALPADITDIQFQVRTDTPGTYLLVAVSGFPLTPPNVRLGDDVGDVVLQASPSDPTLYTGDLHGGSFGSGQYWWQAQDQTGTGPVGTFTVAPAPQPPAAVPVTLASPAENATVNDETLFDQTFTALAPAAASDMTLTFNGPVDSVPMRYAGNGRWTYRLQCPANRAPQDCSFGVTGRFSWLVTGSLCNTAGCTTIQSASRWLNVTYWTRKPRRAFTRRSG